jgi:hypothetical protein
MPHWESSSQYRGEITDLGELAAGMLQSGGRFARREKYVSGRLPKFRIVCPTPRTAASGALCRSGVVDGPDCLVPSAKRPHQSSWSTANPSRKKDLQRALDRLPAEHRQRARQEILERLIDNLLIDQHLLSLQIPAPPDEIEARLRQIQEEVKRSGQDYQKLLQELALTEAELKRQIAAELRWERYLQSQIPDAALQKFFQEHREWFNGSAVQARHILVACPAQADPTQKKQAQQKAEQLRQHILAEVEKTFGTNPYRQQ